MIYIITYPHANLGHQIANLHYSFFFFNYKFFIIGWFGTAKLEDIVGHILVSAPDHNRKEHLCRIV